MSMKRIVLSLAVAGTLTSTVWAGDAVTLKDQKQKDSYSLGYSFGRNVVTQEVDVDEAVLIEAVKDALHRKDPALGQNEMNNTMSELRRKVYAKQEQRMRDQAAKNLEEATAFLAANGKKEGITTLPSGLQYTVLAEGKGVNPKNTDGVRVRYRGMLTNGTEFDNTLELPDSEIPVIPVAGANKGWTEALQLMKPGSKLRFYVPPQLGFGDRPVGKVPANSVLVYEMELLNVVDNIAANETVPLQEKKD